jgi:hypothetical protein
MVGAMYAYRWCRPAGRQSSAIAAALLFATFPAAICISYGQYGVLVLGLQLAAVAALARNRQVIGGILLGVALVKPQLTALLVLALMAFGYVGGALVAAGVAAVGTLAAAVLVHESPWVMVRESFRESAAYHDSHNPLVIGFSASIGHGRALPMLGLAGIALVIVAARRLRKESALLPLAGLTAILTMFWTYRKHFDVALMTLPLIVIWMEFARTRRWRDGVMFLALGLTLWLPLRDDQWQRPALQMIDTVVWLGAALYLVVGREKPGAEVTTAGRL